MSGMQPVSFYAVTVRPGELTPATDGAPGRFRATMAAIDPNAVPEFEDAEAASKAPRSTLKIVRGLDLDEDDDDEDYEDVDEEESSDDDDSEANEGPSDPAKAKNAKKVAAAKELENAVDEDDSGDEVDIKSAMSKIIKGKDKATDEDDDEDSESSGSVDMEEIVLCTLDPEKNYQQPLDFVVGEDERVFFKVVGTHAVYLSGNYLMPADIGSDDEESDEDEDGDGMYDMSPDEDELDDADEESDELDDLENPRVMEIDDEEEEENPNKTLPSKDSKEQQKGANKRPAEEGLDDLIKADEGKLSKKQLKKLKKNTGDAAKTAEAAKADATKNKTPETDKAKPDKKVQFAKNLEQGPTPSPPKEAKGKQSNIRQVDGVTIDERKAGTGQTSKKGDTVEMRYIGKFSDGKAFDSNKKGKPFAFRLGAGEVIKGWDIGVMGMAVGGERRLTIPPHQAYGKKGVPGIPGNSTLTFDIKLINIK